VDGASEEETLAAGDFSPWVSVMLGAIGGRGGSDVPCGSCTACCTSSQFVHIEPDEHETLARIPAELQFRAPGLPRGHVLLGYDERGHCPMLVDGKCSIYAHRPRTCRTYDCRVFPAAGLVPDDDSKVEIARQAGRWRFTYPTPMDRRRQEAVLQAARFLDSQTELLSGRDAPRSATEHAVMALAIHDLFLDPEPEPQVVLAELRRRMGVVPES
jgi:uncharacterized protein